MSLFQMSVAGGVLILFIVVVRALAIHRLPKTTFLALWMIAALRLLLPFSIPLPFNIHIGLDVFSDVVQELPSGNIGSPLLGESLPSYDAGVAVPSPATEHISTFVILWLVGVLLLALYFSISYFRSMRKFRMSIPDNTPYIQNWLTAHQISRPLAVRSSDLISSPLTYGILRPVILLPKRLDRNDQVALKYVLTHEYVHIRRFDAITKILFAAVLCTHWFNPLVWVMYVLANRDMELSCDAWVIRMMGAKNRSSYALMLIKMEERRNGMSALYSHFGKNAISERIEAIMKFKKTSILACTLALALVVGATTAFAAKAHSDTPQTIDGIVAGKDAPAISRDELLTGETQTDIPFAQSINPNDGYDLKAKEEVSFSDMITSMSKVPLEIPDEFRQAVANGEVTPLQPEDGVEVEIFDANGVKVSVNANQEFDLEDRNLTEGDVGTETDNMRIIDPTDVQGQIMDINDLNLVEGEVGTENGNLKMFEYTPEEWDDIQHKIDSGEIVWQ